MYGYDFMRQAEVPWDVIEKNIKPLVEAINIRYKPRLSCEGHLDRGTPYPWVDLETNQNYDDIRERLREYNSMNKIGWDLHGSGLDSDGEQFVQRLMPECEFHSVLSEYRMENMNSERLKRLKLLADECTPLESLQDSAKDLARYLKESWK